MDFLEWKKPTISLFRERFDKPENEPFAVIKAQRIILEEDDEGKFKGKIVDFFTLMGDIEYITTPERRGDRYVLCWFDDTVDDFNDAFRKLTGVTFMIVPSYTIIGDKKSYKVDFKATQGKIR